MPTNNATVRYFSKTVQLPLDTVQVGDDIFTGLMTQPGVSKHWRRVVSHPEKPQSDQAPVTMLW